MNGLVDFKGEILLMSFEKCMIGGNMLTTEQICCSTSSAGILLYSINSLRAVSSRSPSVRLALYHGTSLSRVPMRFSALGMSVCAIMDFDKVGSLGRSCDPNVQGCMVEMTSGQ